MVEKLDILVIMYLDNIFINIKKPGQTHINIV